MYNTGGWGGGVNFYPLLRHKSLDLKRKHTYIHLWIRRLVLETLHSSVHWKTQTGNTSSFWKLEIFKTKLKRFRMIHIYELEV